MDLASPIGDLKSSTVYIWRTILLANRLLVISQKSSYYSKNALFLADTIALPVIC